MSKYSKSHTKKRNTARYFLPFSMLFIDQVSNQSEIQLVRNQYIAEGQPFDALFKRYLEKATEGINNPDVKRVAQEVAGMLLSELTACIGRKMATRKPKTKGGKILYWIANLFWKQKP